MTEVNAEYGLDRLFFPKSMAVVGASPKRGKGWSSGNSYIAGSLKQGFQGRIYPVHPTAESILGFKSYKSIRDIPDEVDLAVFTVPSRAVVDLMEECAEKGVKFAHFLTAGFSETGLDGQADLEEQLVAAARRGGVRIVGPNCMGVYCPEGGLSWTIDFPDVGGGAGFFSQSGQLAYQFIFNGNSFGLKFSKVVSFGNASDLQHHEFLGYLAEDGSTKVIGTYLEGLKDGRRFLEVARRATRKKPLVAWKGGVTEAGSRAARSHTAALAGSPAVWRSVCRQAGITAVENIEDLVLTVSGFLNLPLPRGRGVAIVGGAGGGSVTMTDTVEKEGLRAPRLTEETIRAFGEFIPVEGSSVQNPLDVMQHIQDPANLMRTMELLDNDPHVDAILFSAPAGYLYKQLGRTGLTMFYQLIKDMAGSLNKPFLPILERVYDPLLGLVQLEALEWLSAMGVATFPDIQSAARVLNHMYDYAVYLDS